ncbi:hypothetical protein EB118_20415, partial [bacterium]|nr:hypothetical protein [bacterium]
MYDWTYESKQVQHYYRKLDGKILGTVWQYINNNIVSIFDKCSFYDSYEGALIRMFYYKNKWYLSTNRKLDAYRSKWASKESFGSYFFKALVNAVESNNELREAIGLKEGEKPS